MVVFRVYISVELNPATGLALTSGDRADVLTAQPISRKDNIEARKLFTIRRENTSFYVIQSVNNNLDVRVGRWGRRRKASFLIFLEMIFATQSIIILS